MSDCRSIEDFEIFDLITVAKLLIRKDRGCWHWPCSQGPHDPWLELIVDVKLIPLTRADGLLIEADELTAIFTAAVRTAKG